MTPSNLEEHRAPSRLTLISPAPTRFFLSAASIHYLECLA